MAKSYQVIVTDKAKKDINNILNYLLENASHGVAVDARKQLIESIHKLSDMPSTGHPVPEMLELTQSIVFRQTIVKDAYRVIYQIREMKNSVVVVRVMHVKQGTGSVIDALK